VKPIFVPSSATTTIAKRVDDDVGRGEEPRAAAERGAARDDERRKGRLVERPKKPREPFGVGAGLAFGIRAGLLHPTEVGARAEDGPLAVEDERADVGAGGELDERGRRLRDHRRVEGVSNLRPPKNEPGDAVFDALRDRRRHRGYIRKTGQRNSGNGVVDAAASESPRTRRVSRGAITPSSQSRAVE
jgi:hypothetical protein